MTRIAWTAGLAAMFVTLTGIAARDDGSRLQDALAIEAAMKAAIRQAEPSVACILVSRSDDYRQYGRAPNAERPGQLGEFYADKIVTPPQFNVPDPRYDKARRLDLSDPTNVPESYGSGVVIDEQDRLILTNFHVVRDATKVYVRLPGDKGSYANIHAADARSDLAVLQLINKDVRAPAIRMGDGRAVAKGQFVLSLANPYAAGFRDGSPSASWGIISNVRRRSAVAPTETDMVKLTLPQFNTLLETDTRLNLGCSGGALLDLKGEMIGLTNALAALSGTETPGGFALPMDGKIKAIVEVLRRGEEVEYGFLGIGLPQTEGHGAGYVIGAPMANSPAERAGLRTGDLIMTIDGVRVRDKQDVFLQIGISLAGSTVRIEVAHDLRGPTEPLTAVLAKADAPGPFIATNRPDPKRYGGLRVDYTSVLAQRSPRRDIPPGVMVREIVHGSAAERAQLQIDRIITHVNGRPVNTPAEFYREMGQASGTVSLLIDATPRPAQRIKLELD